MQINGYWADAEAEVQRPIFLVKLETFSGEWIDCPLLADTGADRTVLSADILKQLGCPTTVALRQLGGVGGAVETLEVWTKLRFARTDGGSVVIEGHYAAFSDPTALEESVLGRDVLKLFALIVDQPGNTVCLLHGRHRYIIQEA